MKTKFLAVVLTMSVLAVWEPQPLKAQFTMRRSFSSAPAPKPKVKQVVIVGTSKGILSYVIHDGKRQSFETEKNFYWPLYFKGRDSVRVSVPPYWQSKAENTAEPQNENAFAELLQELYQDGWKMEKAFGAESGEVYIFEK